MIYICIWENNKPTHIDQTSCMDCNKHAYDIITSISNCYWRSNSLIGRPFRLYALPFACWDRIPGTFDSPSVSFCNLFKRTQKRSASMTWNRTLTTFQTWTTRFTPIQRTNTCAFLYTCVLAEIIKVKVCVRVNNWVYESGANCMSRVPRILQASWCVGIENMWLFDGIYCRYV